jgi:hypothetical protein
LVCRLAFFAPFVRGKAGLVSSMMPTRDASVEHVRAVLLHPATLMALGLLTLNDQLLRRLWPSPITGKLGDFAWLTFAPLVAAALLELAWPRSASADRNPACGLQEFAPSPRLWRSRGLGTSARSIGLLGFGLVGGIFALAKTVPACHATVVAVASTLFGFPVGWRRDPTDLVALLALMPAWRLWQRPRARTASNRLAGGLVIAAAALLTVANGPAPDYGYCTVWAAEGKLFATSSYTTHVSSDGGITWQDLAQRPANNCGGGTGDVTGGERVLVDEARVGVRYRYTPGRPIIERSADGGLTWQVDHRLEPTTEAEKAYARKKSSTAEVDVPLPASGAIDPVTGNVVFAMGPWGVLVRQATGKYAWAVGSEGGPFGYGAAKAPELLVGEGVLAIEVFLLGLCTLGNCISRTRVRDIFLVIAWLLWGLAALATAPALSHGYAILVENTLLAAAGVVALPLTADTLFRVATCRPQALPRILLVSAGAALLFLLPYVLWAINAIPLYYLAAAFGIALVAGALFGGKHWVDEMAFRAHPQDGRSEDNSER